jgi:hypothetical protein
MSNESNGSERIHEVLRVVSQDSEALRQLRDEPAALADRFDLTNTERSRLEHSDVLVAFAQNPLRVGVDGSNTQTIKVTITHTARVDDGESGPPFNPLTLEELSYEHLIQITRRILVDPEFATRVREFLDL